ncbi:ABC transporter ATP-binding protein [Geomonas sp.]|uniref:ABC transporter ATP-binding protein n=1 Tax=Geomonas sp. TaxID=2651584 RepID=UPI002B47072A|nr:ATP-binding cassette domain-containing protein [Geomonas sp.]HJV33976.1 ATP-binding cassette domain-containing protein [Geomonas sp.]
MPGTGIRMQRVSYSVGGREILRDFDLTLEKGVDRTILGVSGAGKTTILKLLLGLMPADSGSISIDGVEISELPEARLREVRRPIAVVFQGGALFDSMTVGENVGYRLLEEGKRSEQEIERVVLEKLGFVGLEDAIDLYPAELSGGMKKRVAIARALAADPDYIFFDEPTTGLDPIGVFNICDLMRRLQQQGKTTLTVTHDLHTAFQVSQRFSFLHESRLVFEGTKEELLAADLEVLQEFLTPSERSLFRFTGWVGADHETK